MAYLRVHLIRENFHQEVEIFGAFRGIWDFLPEMAHNNPKDRKKPKINHFSEKKNLAFRKKKFSKGGPLLKFFFGIFFEKIFFGQN